jgi:acyl-CoA reductase-like NAD-dependent aldehyde dehydrogenase
VCLAGTRILVESAIAGDLLNRVRAVVAASPVGDPRDPATKIGPLIHPDALSRVNGYVERAPGAGSEPLWAGKKHGFGELYFEPTLLSHVEQTMEIVQSEVFGPVLTSQTFTGEEEVVQLANGTKYGLAAMVFTRNEARAWRVSKQLTAGSLWVNCFFVRDLAAPFGGARNSGIGREGGTWSMDFYCDVKNVSMLKDSLTLANT